MSKALVAALAALVVACLLAGPVDAAASERATHPYARADRGVAERTSAPTWVERRSVPGELSPGRAPAPGPPESGAPQIIKHGEEADHLLA